MEEEQGNEHLCFAERPLMEQMTNFEENKGNIGEQGTKENILNLWEQGSEPILFQGEPGNKNPHPLRGPQYTCEDQPPNFSPKS